MESLIAFIVAVMAILIGTIAQAVANDKKRRAAARETADRVAQATGIMEDWQRFKWEKAAQAAAERTTAAQAKVAERERKSVERAARREYERQQAETDLEYLEGLRAGYMDILDILEEELNDSTTSDKRRLTIRRQMLTTEEKLHRLDAKMAKAYFTANLIKEVC